MSPFLVTVGGIRGLPYTLNSGYPERFESVKDLLFLLLFVGVWLVLQVWVLPRLGVRT
jgi:hypothetical protein